MVSYKGQILSAILKISIDKQNITTPQKIPVSNKGIVYSDKGIIVFGKENISYTKGIMKSLKGLRASEKAAVATT